MKGLNLPSFCQESEHDNGGDFHLPNHSPKIVNCASEWSWKIPGKRTVNTVGIEHCRSDLVWQCMHCWCHIPVIIQYTSNHIEGVLQWYVLLAHIYPTGIDIACSRHVVTKCFQLHSAVIIYWILHVIHLYTHNNGCFILTGVVA